MNTPLDIDVQELIDGLAQQLRPAIAQVGTPVMVGIHTGGAWLAQRLHSMLALESRLCSLNISFYRDDFSRRGLHPNVGPSEMPESVENRHVILVDDVLHTGRTVRAAMNELFDYGRPASIRLLALVDRGGHELPITPDYVGIRLPDTPAEQQIKMTGPEPLTLITR